MEINVKTITQDPIDPKNYKKGAYLKPFRHQRSGSGVDEATKNEQDSLGLQPQIHKRFLSINNTLSAGVTSRGVEPLVSQKTIASSFYIDKSKAPLDMSLNNVQFNRLIN